MKIDIRYQPAYSLAIVGLNPDESIQAEAGAMVLKNPAPSGKGASLQAGWRYASAL